MRRRAWTVVLVVTACARPVMRPVEVVEPSLPRVSEAEVARTIPRTVKDRDGWAADIVEALDALELGRSPTSVCSVVAVIEQESGFNPNPVVPGLARIVQERLDRYSAKLGLLGRPALHALLQGHGPSSKETFEQRLEHVKTEKDLDVIFRELLDYYDRKYPTTMMLLDTLGGAFTASHLEDLNPVTTAGSMQVSVRYATQQGEASGLTGSMVRDRLYTRRGGVHYGTARLLGYDAAYADPLYRFADYNAGLYASRNAALQAQLAELTGFKLTADGDLLAYNRVGRPTDALTNTVRALMAWRTRYARSLSDAQLRRDAATEKTAAFEATETWRALKRTYEHHAGRAPAYARMPDVTITSPKMKRDRSTAWYARNVNLRFQACLGKLRARAPEA
ncbi:MAG: DUF1615 family protein [Deltaproteobacteria bacterium]|nr:DUF1615 family protein [Deltaproteobacteria bacterium]